MLFIVGDMMIDFHEKVNEKIKQYSNDQYLDGYIKNEFLTEDGDADIYLKVRNKDELFDSRTLGDQIDLNKEVFEFIEEKTSMLDNDVQINLHIVGCRLNNKERDLVKHILKEHYAIELYKKQKEYKNSKSKVFTLFLVGILSILCYLYLYLFTDFEFFLEVFGFIFSFSLWEAFDLLIYEFSDIKYDREAITQNLLLEVDFEHVEKFQILES